MPGNGCDSCHCRVEEPAYRSGHTGIRCFHRFVPTTPSPRFDESKSGSRVRLFLSLPGLLCERPIHRASFGRAITFSSSFIEAYPILESGPRPALQLSHSAVFAAFAESCCTGHCRTVYTILHRSACSRTHRQRRPPRYGFWHVATDFATISPNRAIEGTQPTRPYRRISTSSTHAPNIATSSDRIAPTANHATPPSNAPHSERPAATPGSVAT